MIAIRPLFRVEVRHAFDGTDRPTRRIAAVVVDTRCVRRHRLTVRPHPDGCLVAFDGRSGRPRFGLPAWIDLALVTDDAHLDGLTAWPDGARASRPSGLSGVRRRALPFYVAELTGTGEAVARPVPEPTWLARRTVRLDVSSDQSLPIRLVDGAGGLSLDATSDPDPLDGAVRLAADLLERAPDRWRLSVGEHVHAVYAAALPERTMAIARIDLRQFADVVIEPSEVRLDLDVVAHIWTWRIVPAHRAGPGPIEYTIEHPSLEIDNGRPIRLGDRPAVSFSSTTPIPWRARPTGPFSLWSMTNDNQRRLLIERLPTPSPRALRPAVDVHL